MKKALLILSLMLAQGSILSMEKQQKRRYQPEQNDEQPQPKKLRAEIIVTPENARRMFLKAARTGDLDLLERALAQGAPLDAHYRNGNQATHVAARNGHFAILQCLLYHSADINARNNSHQTPAHEAALNGRVDVLQWLKEHGALLTACDGNGDQPLHLAAYGNFNVLKWLVEQRIDINSTNNNGHSAVCLAIGMEQMGIALWLVSQGASIASLSDEDLRAFIVYPSITKTMRLLAEGDKQLTEGELAPLYDAMLHEASFADNLELAQIAIAHGVDINVLSHRGRTPLEVAVKNGSRAMIRWLLEHGAELPQQKQKILEYFQQEPLVRILMAGGYQPASVLSSAMRDRSVDDLNRNLPLIVALGQVGLLNLDLSRMANETTMGALNLALETAAAVNTMDMFTALYSYLRERVERAELTHEEFVVVLENALYWAAIRGNENIVEYILNEAFAFGIAPGLSLARTGTHVTQLLKRLASEIENSEETESEEESEDEKEKEQEEEEEFPQQSNYALIERQATLNRIRDRLMHASRCRLASNPRVIFEPHLNALENTTPWIQSSLSQLPAITATLILTLALHPSKPG